MANFSPARSLAMKPTSSLGRFGFWSAALAGAVAIAPALLLGFPQETARAQSSSNANDLGEWQTNERDSRSIGDTGLTPLELIQRIRSLSGQSPAEFDARQEGRLNDAAESFRQQQRQRLGSPGNTTDPSSGAGGGAQ
ncbi:MAG: hypothetical protein AAF889_00795 [Cyanobacteria bacterium P01_D01_bin.73]